MSSVYGIIAMNNEDRHNQIALRKKNNLRDPELWCKTFKEKDYFVLKQISRGISIVSRLICLVVIFSCFYSIISSIPSEISSRIDSLEFIHEQVREECLIQYTENMCNTTTLPEMQPFCKEKLDCIEKPFSASSTWAIAQYVIDLKDIFFRTLSSRSSVLFGMISAVFAFFALKKLSYFIE